MTKSKSGNNQRSNTKNPNNSAFKAALDNRSNQKNPSDTRSKGKGNK